MFAFTLKLCNYINWSGSPAHCSYVKWRECERRVVNRLLLCSQKHYCSFVKWCTVSYEVNYFVKKMHRCMCVRVCVYVRMCTGLISAVNGVVVYSLCPSIFLSWECPCSCAANKQWLCSFCIWQFDWQIQHTAHKAVRLLQLTYKCGEIDIYREMFVFAWLCAR